MRSRRLFAAGTHFLFSLAVAAACAFVVFRIWYPAPFDVLAGGISLFLLVIAVDVVLGPTLTAVVAAPKKPLPELRRDLAIIVLVQLAGLAYGLWTIAQARPVFLSYEIDRFRVVTAADVETSMLDKAPAALQKLPWLGPQTIAAVKPSDPQEQLRSIDLGLAGIDLSMVPANWRGYASQSDAAWRAARPAKVLLDRYPAIAADVQRIAEEAHQPIDELRFLPVLSRRESWVALMAQPQAQVVGYLPVEGFF